jgi:predicted dehydrogenase
MGSIAQESTAPVLRVGIIGCGEISQVAHIPNINFLSHRFRITYLCDISQDSLRHCAQRVLGETPRLTSSAKELCSSPDVDVVIIANADAYHVDHGIHALQNDKYCLIEKPASICFRDIDRLIEAERTSQGKVFVGTMRRYAPAFLDAVEEVGGMEKITYARVRDIIGPNATFVDQSCTFPQRFNDFSELDSQDRMSRENDIYEQALSKEFGLKVTPETQRMLRVLGALVFHPLFDPWGFTDNKDRLGTHDLSAMREIIGMPDGVAGAFLKLPGIFSVLFKYNGFPVTYESGLNEVPQFDAHIEVYSPAKIVRVEFDTPYVRGLPATITVREKLGTGGFQERKVRKTYEDAYTLELLDFYDCAVNKKSPKSSAQDARQDIELFKMIMVAGFSQ